MACSSACDTCRENSDWHGAGGAIDSLANDWRGAIDAVVSFSLVSFSLVSFIFDSLTCVTVIALMSLRDDNLAATDTHTSDTTSEC